MNYILRFASIVLCSVVLSSIGYKPDTQVINAIFTVNGIFFSIGYGLTVAINLDTITDETFLNIMRSNILKIQKYFIKYFTLSALSFASIELIDKSFLIWKGRLSVNVFFFTVMCYVLVYLIVNFTRVQKFKDDLTDILRKNK